MMEPVQAPLSIMQAIIRVTFFTMAEAMKPAPNTSDRQNP